MLVQLKKEKNKNFRFTLTTNGMLIDDEVITRRKQVIFIHIYVTEL